MAVMVVVYRWWWINDLTRYQFVDPLNPGDVKDDGYFQFIDGSHINTSLAGYYQWKVKNGYNMYAVIPALPSDC